MGNQHDDGAGAEPHDLTASYVLDALRDLQRTTFEAHLAGCPACRTEVADLREAAVALSEGLELAPPADLRRRVLHQVATEPRPAGSRAVGPDDASGSSTHGPGPASAAAGRSPRGWWLGAAAAVIIGAGTWVTTQVLQVQDPATLIVEASDAQEFDAAEGEVSVIVSPRQDAAVLHLLGDLEPPPQGKVYQAWYVGADGSARSAGVLNAQVLEDGKTVLEGGLNGAAAVGLTVEPHGGSDQPSSEPFAVVPLG